MHKRFGLLSLVNFCMQIETSVWLTFERTASNRFQVNNTRLPVRPKETPKICHHIFQFVPILKKHSYNILIEVYINKLL